MENFKYKQEDIHKYLELKLSENEQQEFEAYVSQNEDFRREVEMTAFLLHKEQVAQVQNFNEILSNYQQNESKQKTKTVYLKWWKVAAVFVLAIGLGIISYQYFGKQQSAQQLALQEWQQPESWSSTRMGDDTASDLSEKIKEVYQAAYKEYEQKGMEKALAILAKTPNSEAASKTTIWLVSKDLEAHIYFEQKKYKQAIAIYEDLTQRNIKEKGELQMKLALCYLADEQAEKAKVILKDLLSFKRFEKQAEKLLKAIK